VPTYAQNQEEASQLTTRILCDTLPLKPVDACYVMGETVDNQDSSINGAVDCYAHNQSRAIIICTGHTRNGYSGAEYIRAKLKEKGYSGPILNSNLSEDVFNTYTELKALINFAKDEGLESVGIVAPEFHLVRAFVTAVSCAIKFYPKLKLYTQRGSPLPWQNVVKHSQGKLVGTRLELLVTEWARLSVYSQKGDILLPQEILSYLTNRDK